ncbi:MAG: NAD(P)H-dependent oxidoreductase [Pseudomonadota bacterium]
MTQTILNIQASARHEGSVTRDLSGQVLEKLGADQVITRDLSDPLPLLDGVWIGANFTPEAERSAEQKETLALSDSLIAEIKAADTLVIGVPVYNFAPPAALKAWIDQICRAGVTFKYTEHGPKGLLEGKRAIIVLASGGTPAGSEMDFASGYLRHILGFIGITDVTLIAADALGNDADKKLDAAKTAIADL